ncbi:MAG: nitroreductase family protein [Anaerolineaceae bacterium]|nr:nitroreductase family protein [Anaerolineaceae bacterium]
MEDIQDIIYKRRSIREYQDRPVEEQKLTLLVKAAMAAPTACNNQPWEFVIVTEKAVMDVFREKMSYGKYNAPAAIVVCGNPEVYLEPSCGMCWVQDCSAATENMLLAAVGLDLGTVWLGVYPDEKTINKVREVVALPENVTPLGVIYVGYPGEEKEARTQYEERRVHWQKY